MTDSLYEAHITYKAEHRAHLEALLIPGWKFSAIDGDPVLGKEVYCYLTSYDKDGKNLLARMQRTVETIGFEAVRQKVEQIVYDTKTGRNNL